MGSAVPARLAPLRPPEVLGQGSACPGAEMTPACASEFALGQYAAITLDEIHADMLPSPSSGPARPGRGGKVDGSWTWRFRDIRVG